MFFRDRKFVYLLLDACLGGEVWTMIQNSGFWVGDIEKMKYTAYTNNIEIRYANTVNRRLLYLGA